MFRMTRTGDSAANCSRAHFCEKKTVGGILSAQATGSYYKSYLCDDEIAVISEQRRLDSMGFRSTKAVMNFHAHHSSDFLVRCTR